MQYFAVYGLANYGYQDLAREVAHRFINTVNKGFTETHQLYEKYDVQHMTTQTTTKINYGYSTNEPGFGLTNCVYLSLTDYLAQDVHDDVSLRNNNAIKVNSPLVKQATNTEV